MAMFSKKSKNGWSGSFSYQAPMSLTDPKWEKLVTVPSAHIIELALRAWVIDAQRVVDGCKTYKEAVELLKGWKFGMKVKRVQVVEVAKELTKEVAAKLNLTDEQIEMMKAEGIIK